MASATPTWLDKLLNKLISVAGVAQPQRGTLDFQSGFSVTDDPTNDTLHVTGTGGTALSAINVKDAPYLAVGDGVHDDTAAIQAALNAAYTLLGYGRRVIIPAGTYKITSTLTVSRVFGIQIEGEGDLSILKWAGSFTAGSHTPLLMLEGCYKPRIANLQFQTAAPVSEYILLKSHSALISTQATIDKCLFQDVAGASQACIFIGTGPDTNNDFHHINDCRFIFSCIAIRIANSQVYNPKIENCVFNTAILTDTHGQTTLSTTLVTSAGTFGPQDVGKTIEVVGAGSGGNNLRTTIASYTDSTHVVMADAAVAAINPATIVYGPQAAVYSSNADSGGNYIVSGGGGGNFLLADFVISSHNSGAVVIKDYDSENSRALLTTLGVSAGSHRVCVLQGVTYNASGMTPANTHAIAFGFQGPLSIIGCLIGTPDVDTGVAVDVFVGTGVTLLSNQYSLRDTIITSSLPISSLFPLGPPITVQNCKLNNGSGTTLLPYKSLEINGSDYGMYGDGAHDDTAAFTAALTAAAAVGGSVYLPPTSSFYSLSAITLPGNVRIRGAHSQDGGSTSFGTVLKFTGAGFTINGNDILLEDMVIAGASASGPLLSQPNGTTFTNVQARNVRFVVGNAAAHAVQFGNNTDGGGCQNSAFDFSHVDILAAHAQSAPLIGIYGVSGGLGSMTWRHCTLTGGGTAGGANASTAEFIRVDTTDGNGTGPILFEDVRLNIPVAGGWVLAGADSTVLRNCTAGGLGATPNTAPLVAIKSSAHAGGQPSEDILIDTLSTLVGLATSGLESVNVASGQGSVLIVNCQMPSLASGSIDKTAMVFGGLITTVNGPTPPGFLPFSNNGDFHVSFLDILEGNTTGLTGGLVSDLQPNVYSSFYRATGTPTGPVLLGGIVSFPQAPGRVLFLDYQLSQPLVIVNEDPSSTAVYRFTTPNGKNLVLGTGCTVTFIYDGTTSRWRVAGYSASYVASGTLNTQANQEVEFRRFDHLTGISTTTTLSVPVGVYGSSVGSVVNDQSATIIVDAVARVTTAGGTASVGDTYTARIQFGAKNVAGTVSRAGSLNTPFAVDADSSMSTCAFTSSVSGTNLQIILTMPATFGAGTVVDTTLRAKVLYN